MSVGLDIIYRFKKKSPLFCDKLYGYVGKFSTDNCRNYSVGILIFFVLWTQK